MRFKITLLLFTICTIVQAQNPLRFKADIENFKVIPTPEGEVTVITGSSSVRFWTDVGDDCGDPTIINTGFGGSETSDLLYYLDATVLRFRPAKVFIYEGDNDINSGKTPTSILKTASQVVGKIRTELPESEIYMIGTKPCPSRWQYREQYVEYNQLLKTYCERMEKVTYIDVWQTMLNESGRPKPEIFIADSLHMNRKGYDLWKAAICEFMN